MASWSGWVHASRCKILQEECQVIYAGDWSNVFLEISCPSIFLGCVSLLTKIGLRFPENCIWTCSSSLLCLQKISLSIEGRLESASYCPQLPSLTAKFLYWQMGNSELYSFKREKKIRKEMKEKSITEKKFLKCVLMSSNPNRNHSLVSLLFIIKKTALLRELCLPWLHFFNGTLEQLSFPVAFPLLFLQATLEIT